MEIMNDAVRREMQILSRTLGKTEKKDGIFKEVTLNGFYGLGN